MLSAGLRYKPNTPRLQRNVRNRRNARALFKPIEENPMNFVSIRIITSDVSRLVDFYEGVTDLKATRFTEDFAELATPACTLAIGSERTVALFGAGSARQADNHSCIIEFRVADVDKEYARLESIVSAFVQKPTTMPWGNRSILFRDPDGNLVNFFTPVSAEAIKKFDAGSAPV
jgi:predicted enzyme related to lactoylglutathione lyase